MHYCPGCLVILKAGRPSQPSHRRSPMLASSPGSPVPALASPLSCDRVVMAGTRACRGAGSRSRPEGRTGLSGRPHRVPTSPRPRPAAPTKTPRTERHYPVQDGTAASMALGSDRPSEKRKLNSIICHNAPLINAGHGVSRGAIKVATTRHGIVSQRPKAPSRGVATTTTPNQRPRISQQSARTSAPVSSSRHSRQRSSRCTMPATAARCGRALASRRAAINVSAGVRTLTTTA